MEEEIMKKKIIFLDIDGTLITDKETVNQLVIDKVNYLKSLGWTIALATGRTVGQAKQVISDLAITNGVFANGQTVMIDNEIIYQHVIPAQISKEIYTKARKHNLNIGYVTPDGIFLNRNLKGMVVKYKLRKYPFGGIKLAKLAIDNVQGYWFFAQEKDLKQFNPQQISDFKVYQYGENTLEVLPQKFDKQKGVERFLAQLDSPVYTVAIGDGTNDLEIFDIVDTKIAMANAIEKLQEKADFVTKSNIENGVAHAIDYLIANGL